MIKLVITPTILWTTRQHWIDILSVSIKWLVLWLLCLWWKLWYTCNCMCCFFSDQWFLRDTLQVRGPTIDHLIAFGCIMHIICFEIWSNITKDSSNFVTYRIRCMWFLLTLLKGSPYPCTLRNTDMFLWQ